MVIVMVDSNPVATATVNGWASDCPMLGWIHVLPKYRRSGFATLIIKECIAKFRRDGKKSITLTCNKKNKAALRLYEKLGFKICNDDPNLFWMSIPLV